GPSVRRLPRVEPQGLLAPGGGGEQVALAPRPAHQLDPQGQVLGAPSRRERYRRQAGVAPRRDEGGGGGAVRGGGRVRGPRGPEAGFVVGGVRGASTPSRQPSISSPSRHWCSLQRAYSGAAQARPSSSKERMQGS